MQTEGQNNEQMEMDVSMEDGQPGESVLNGATVAEGTSITELQKKIEELTAINNELKEQQLRTHADFDNMKKRMLRDKEQEIRFANQGLLLVIVSFIDDLERALQQMMHESSAEALKSGIELIERQLVSTLEQRWGLQKYNALKDAFDPNIHEAIAMEESADVTAPTVIEVYQNGYMLHDRIMRTAKVKVARPLPANSDPDVAVQSDGAEEAAEQKNKSKDKQKVGGEDE